MIANGLEDNRTEDVHNTNLQRYIYTCSVSTHKNYILLCLFSLHAQSFSEANARGTPTH
jgi:hypothetical protein